MRLLNRLIVPNVITGILIGLVLLLIVIAPLRVNHDVGHLLLVARMIVEGHLPYVEIRDINMPITHYLHIIPTLIGRILDINPITIFLILVLVLTIAGILFVHRLSQLHPDLLSPTVISMGTLSIALMTVGLYLVNDYGQRDHLFILFFLPGFILRWLRWNRREIPLSLAITAGVMAAIGALIKPHFLIIILLVELFWLLKYWKLHPIVSPELGAFVGFSALYGLHLFILPSAERAAIIEWFSFVLNVGYKAYGYHEPLDLMLRMPTLIAIGLTPFVLAVSDHKPTNDLLESLGVLVLVGVVEMGIQQRGYPYHVIPAAMAAATLIGMALAVVAVQKQSAQTTPAKEPPLRVMTILQQGLLISAILGLFWLGLGLNLSTLHQNLTVLPNNALREVIQEYSQENDPILFVTSDLPHYAVLIQENRTSASGALPALAVVFSYFEMPEEDYANGVTPPAVKDFLDTLREDISRKRPPLIFISNVTACTACASYLNFHDFLLRTQILQEAILPVYEYVGGIDGYEVYHYVGDPESTLGEGILFDEAIKLSAWKLQNEVNATACQPLTVDTWWEAQAPVDNYYNMSLVLSQNSNGIAHIDGTPSGIDTLNWQPDQRYTDSRTLQIPCDTPSGEYLLLLVLYTVNVPDSTLATASYADGTPIGNYFYLTTITVR